MFIVLAHEAYTWDELAAAIRKAYIELTQVYVLPKFINWSESIHPYLNVASTTPGGSAIAKKQHTQSCTTNKVSCVSSNYFTNIHFSGFQGFSDYRCFHVCKKHVTVNGITKEVGVVECKPDAGSPTWGDTTGTPGKTMH